MRSLAAAIIVLCVCGAAAFGNDIVPRRWETLMHQTGSQREASMRGDWKPVSPPLKFRLPYPVTWDYQHLWLRSSFIITDDPPRYFGVTLGNVYLVNAVYINGRMIGELSPGECRSIHTPVRYAIPTGTLQKGGNDIYIRLGMYDTETAGITGDIAIRDRARYLASATLEDLLYISYPLGIIIFLVTLFLFSIVLFIWDRSELIFLHSAALCIILASALAFLFPAPVPVSHEYRLHLMYGFYPMMALITLFAAQSMGGRYFPAINRAAVPGLMLLTAAALCARFLHLSTAVPVYINIAVILTFLPAVVYMIILTYRTKRDRFTLVISAVCLAAPAAAGAAEVASMVLCGSPPPEIYFVLSPLLLVGLVIFNVRKIMLRKVNLIVMYRDFQRSLKQPDKKTVTPATEGKIAEVIRFLDENYRADISREGLAAAVDLSPDHLSRMFKASTGRRISDYINERRVREAALLLAETDDRIADIAMRVGFESLTTFNRNFAKVMGAAPADYRK